MLELGKTNWGEWKDSQWNDGDDKLWLCGTKARIEAPQGTGDDTALNGLQVARCEVPKVLDIKLTPQTAAKCDAVGVPKTVEHNKTFQTECEASTACTFKETLQNSISETNTMRRSKTILRKSTEGWSNSKSISATAGYSNTLTFGGKFPPGTNMVGMDMAFSASLTAAATFE